MPVLSPRHSSSLSGSYRSTFSSSLTSRPYYGSSAYTTTPRITTTSYSERYSTKTYNTDDGKKLYSRHASITEDGITSRYREQREETREKSLRRDSLNRDQGGFNGSARSSTSMVGGDRELSITRDSRDRNYSSSTLSMIDSVADLRNKYSPSNYVPAVLRKDIERSKSINDIGRPPTSTSLSASSTVNEKTQKTCKKDITTSPRLPRSSISQSSSISTANQRSSPSNTRASPTNNRASPAQAAASSTLDTIRARSLLSQDEDGLAGGRYERGSGSGSSARSQGLNGLKNIGNTCFMNSVIQCLSNTKYLLEYVREDGYMGDINTSISSMKGALIKAFSQVIQELWSPDSSDKVVNTVALKSQIQRFAPRFMGYAQQDAQEFLRYLLEGLHEDVNRVTTKPKPIITEIDETLSDSQKANEAWSRYLRMDNSRVVDIFVGQLKSTLRCTHCGHCSVTFDPFWDLSLPIPQRQGPLRLGQCLEHFTREETLDGDEKPTCSKCKERRKCTKSFCIQKFPKILVIHLKRFSPTERFRGKLSLVIDFPLQGLDLSAFAASKSQTESMYNLYAISNHSGTTYSGHYTAYCKHPYSGQWHEYNDSRVSSISSKNVVSSEAYVLFYELINQNSHL